jgi:hypothetical protein
VTTPGRRRLAALLLAAVIGISGGVAAALIGSAEPEPAEDPPTVTEPLTHREDPLGLGVRRADLDCDGKTYLLVGWGADDNALSPAQADWPAMKYARTDDSCPTAWPQVGGVPAKWVAYLPPYDTPAAACVERMTAAHKNDFTTRMQRDNDSSVLCPCVMEKSSLPVVGEGQELSTESGMWIYQFQTLLAAAYPDAGVGRTNYFDEATSRATRLLQTQFGLNPTNTTDADTWDALRGKACRLFNF